MSSHFHFHNDRKLSSERTGLPPVWIWHRHPHPLIYVGGIKIQFIEIGKQIFKQFNPAYLIIFLLISNSCSGAVCGESGGCDWWSSHPDRGADHQGNNSTLCYPCGQWRLRLWGNFGPLLPGGRAGSGGKGDNEVRGRWSQPRLKNEFFHFQVCTVCVLSLLIFYFAIVLILLYIEKHFHFVYYFSFGIFAT